MQPAGIVVRMLGGQAHSRLYRNAGDGLFKGVRLIGNGLVETGVLQVSGDPVSRTRKSLYCHHDPIRPTCWEDLEC